MINVSFRKGHIMRDVNREKLDDAVTAELAQLTRRDVRLPQVPRKVQAIIGTVRPAWEWMLEE